MAIKEILLHLDNSPSCLSRIDLAIRLAQIHGAHLKGIYILPHEFYAPHQGNATTEPARKAEELFISRAAESGISYEWLFVDWTVVGTKVNEILNLYSFYSDIIIVGQPDHSSPDRNTPYELPERLGLSTGKPLLVVPYAGSFSASGNRIMIAWKAGREASRVVHDALPILCKASHVTIVTVDTKVHEDSSKRDLQSLSTYLGRHGISAAYDQIQTSPNFPVGDALLNYACEQKMDLLVMGAFAQNRRGNYLFGPITRHLMNHMTLPVFISH